MKLEPIGAAGRNVRAAVIARTLLFGFAWVCMLFWLVIVFRVNVYEPFKEAFTPDLSYHYAPAKELHLFTGNVVPHVSAHAPQPATSITCTRCCFNPFQYWHLCCARSSVSTVA